MLVNNPAGPTFFIMYINTPDKIKQGKSAYVAVYGTLKRGNHNHRVMGDSEYIGTARISGFEMYSLGGFPGVLPGEGEITVEIFRVNNTRDAEYIYRLEGYNGVRGHHRNSFYDTTDISVNIDGQDYTAEMFIYKGGRLNSRVESGEW